MAKRKSSETTTIFNSFQKSVLQKCFEKTTFISKEQAETTAKVLKIDIKKIFNNCVKNLIN